MNDKIKAHILMIFLVITWGFDYIVAKFGMYELTPTNLLFLKLAAGAIVVGIMKAARRDRSFIKKRDIPILVACAFFGEIMYFECEYNAMTYLPVALLTIVLSFVPAVSIAIERVLFKREPNRKIIIGILFCIIGIVFVIGADFHILLEGRLIGYIIAFGAVIFWNVYNFITASLEDYDAVTISFLQLLFSCIMIAPVALHNMVPPTQWSGTLWLIIAYMGIINSGIGYVLSVYALKVIGPTPSAVYSNFLPVTTAIFGAVFLHEMISPLQIIGGIIVVVAGWVVIREKGRLDEQRQGMNNDNVCDIIQSDKS